MTYLNLGCGRVILPTAPDNPMMEHLISQLQKMCPQALDMRAQWINVDRVPGPGVNEVFDLFTYPWLRQSNASPFSDNSIDGIWCSHICEHIPHAATLAVGASNFPDLVKVAKHDGWYAFFYEAWRILKPGGLIHIVAPYAYSIGAMADPTHHRFIVPGSFSYFMPNPDAPFDYDLPMRFEAVDHPEFKLLGDAVTLFQQVGQIKEQHYSMAPSEPGYDAMEHTMNDWEDRLYKTMFSRVDTIETFSISLRAVKDMA